MARNDITVIQKVFSRMHAERHGYTYFEGAMLCRILKSGKPGKPQFYKAYGEKTAEEIIKRLESNNPGSRWVLPE